MLFSTTALTPAHAKKRPPSSAGLWIPCPGSATVNPLYPNDSSVHSDKGDLAHSLLEDAIVFGVHPDSQDPDMDMNISGVLDWIAARKKEYGPDCKVYAEKKYDIPETGEFGTCDVTMVSPDMLHIADYKNGFVLTDAREQMLTYLLGAIALFGTRGQYRITVLQPNHNHRDGPYRTYDITPAEVEEFRAKVRYSMASTEFKAGAHCKKYYCDHRGSCKTFLAWAQTEGEDAWFPHEVNAMSDNQLAVALDHADTLHGVRDSYRKEAMRRIAQHDRKIPGYKLVKSRVQRDFAGDAGRAGCYEKLLEFGYAANDLYERKPFSVGTLTLYEQTPLSVAGVERMVKQKYKSFKAGTWKKVWDEHFRPHLREFSSSLTLERETDGRPAHTRGSEFGAIAPPAQVRPTQVL